MTVVVRLAVLDDRAGVEAVVEAAYAPYVARLGCKPGPMLDDYADLITDCRVHVLDAGGFIAGVVVLMPQNDAMLLENVAVLPSCQGLGYGRRLLEFAERAALDAGYGAVRLYTNEAMTENITLYGRIDFIETHRAEEKGYRRVHMRKALT
jgi:GNAT superfamily N-acetyltransferase